ncbi:MAG TPA: YfcE family phosphodiesterase [Spirochaetota bacterium]|nr:YfcE family phosphodiesterase [Spirochaetota bacterium]HOD14123.1 YfcE family phosphodiesterase [Spirochaetota bacterium]HPG49170.1 YfcE family phosphodiesterase [Spirochaetota bacterium]HPN10780.1 YfcE family phosphodiesterase [Spirochaetota bacterium]HQL81079.1 YfcE family phosphodiesterase [Spirochaetota bacterium]
MLKILVVSDTHGNTVRLGRIVRRESPFDYLFHCGDGAGDLAHVEVPAGAAVVRVCGNVDMARNLDAERLVVMQVGTVTVMAAHGDQFHVNYGYQAIEREGRSRNADIVLFGHTHASYHGGTKPVLFNPGSANNGRYGLLYVDSSISVALKILED